MAKVKARVTTTVRKSGSGVKAGSTMPKNVGGVVNAKVVAIVKKKNG